MNAEASTQNQTRCDTVEQDLARRSVELVRSTVDSNVRWEVGLVLAGQHHQVAFGGLKSRPLDLPAVLSRHLAGITGGKELLAVPHRECPDHDAGRIREDTASRPHGGGATEFLAAMLQALADQLLVADLAVRLDLPDAIHQLRVTCRSMRAVLRAAAPFLERRQTEDLNLRLRQLARTCAPARDAEVTARLLSGGLEPPAVLHDGSAPVQHEALLELQALALAHYTEAARAVRRVLQQKEHSALLTEVRKFVLHPPFTERVKGTTVKQLANRLLRRGLRSVTRAAARSPEGQDPRSSEEIALRRTHDVRKAAKRVRYVAATLHHAGIRPRKRFRRSARIAKKYQRELGAVVDSALVLEWLSRVAAEQSVGADRYGVGLVQGAAAARFRSALQRSEDLISEFLSHLETN